MACYFSWINSIVFHSTVLKTHQTTTGVLSKKPIWKSERLCSTLGTGFSTSSIRAPVRRRCTPHPSARNSVPARAIRRSFESLLSLFVFVPDLCRDISILIVLTHLWFFPLDCCILQLLLRRISCWHSRVWMQICFSNNRAIFPPDETKSTWLLHGTPPRRAKAPRIQTTFPRRYFSALSCVTGCTKSARRELSQFPVQELLLFSSLSLSLSLSCSRSRLSWRLTPRLLGCKHVGGAM